MVITNQVVWLSPEHLDIILQEYATWRPKETGGILMGYRTGNEFRITDLVGPGPKARHELCSFTPDNDYHEAEMARIYRESGRIHTYLGDWHTHPGNRAYLSGRDKTTMRNISGNKLCRLPQPLMLILGTSPLQLKGWQYQPGSMVAYRPVQINLIK